MSNTIDNTFEIGINSMNPLSFTWTAIFSDGSKISQFENGKERLFKEVKDKFDDLVYFNLAHIDGGKLFSVDLQQGMIGYNELVFPYIKSINYKHNIRLVYFRRNRKEFTQDGKQISHIRWYFLGFQYNDEQGYNHKIILKISEDGSFTIGE